MPAIRPTWPSMRWIPVACWPPHQVAPREVRRNIPREKDRPVRWRAARPCRLFPQSHTLPWRLFRCLIRSGPAAVEEREVEERVVEQEARAEEREAEERVV